MAPTAAQAARVEAGPRSRLRSSTAWTNRARLAAAVMPQARPPPASSGQCRRNRKLVARMKYRPGDQAKGEGGVDRSADHGVAVVRGAREQGHNLAPNGAGSPVGDTDEAGPQPRVAPQRVR
jgi:hypothetical protein